MGYTFKAARTNFLLLFIFTTSSIGFSQNKFQFYEKGFLTGFGHGTTPYNLPEGTYRPVFFMGNLGIDLLKNRKETPFNGKLILYFEPQFNVVFIQNKVKNINSFETGINVGIKQTYVLNHFIHVYVHVGSGPEYFTANTEKQTQGFLFSDNLGAGAYLFLKKNLALNIGFRLRHMSNANIKWPNSGINTYNYIVGLSFFAW